TRVSFAFSSFAHGSAVLSRSAEPEKSNLGYCPKFGVHFKWTKISQPWAVALCLLHRNFIADQHNNYRKRCTEFSCAGLASMFMPTSPLDNILPFAIAPGRPRIPATTQLSQGCHLPPPHVASPFDQI